MESGRYARRRYLEPQVQAGLICMTLPEKPRSPRQRYVSAPDVV